MTETTQSWCVLIFIQWICCASLFVRVRESEISIWFTSYSQLITNNLYALFSGGFSFHLHIRCIKRLIYLANEWLTLNDISRVLCTEHDNNANCGCSGAVAAIALYTHISGTFINVIFLLKFSAKMKWFALAEVRKR